MDQGARAVELPTNLSYFNETIFSRSQKRGSVWASSQVQIPLYATILLLSVVGNVLVIVTLIQNKRMRTVTNVFLLNLAFGDLLLGVFCMPFTLVGTILREFIFGEIMCKLIPYFQAVSISVSAWTLVAISIERYFAICQPLKSRRWQTLSHAYKMIAIVWVASLLCMSPVVILSQLQPLRNSGDKVKCREAWPKPDIEQAFSIFLDVILLVIPLVIMIITYSSISANLRKSMNSDAVSNVYHGKKTSPSEPTSNFAPNDSIQEDDANSFNQCTPHRTKPQKVTSVLRYTNSEKCLVNKQRVIRMLFVVVLEFFVCWTPIHVVNTLSLFIPRFVYMEIGTAGISLFQLLAYTSSCCNPITYCFMNEKFRRAFLSVFNCCSRRKNPEHQSSSTTSYIIKDANGYVS